MVSKCRVDMNRVERLDVPSLLSTDVSTSRECNPVFFVGLWHRTSQSQHCEYLRLWILEVGASPGYFRLFSSMPGLHSLDISPGASSKVGQNVSRHCQLLAGAESP